jgi:hypothetical protein
VVRRKFKAEALAGSVKYGPVGAGFELGGLDLEGRVKQDLANIAEHSITKKTWGTYKSAERMLATFCLEKGKKLELPTSESVILGFIHWLTFERNLKAASISGYLAGIKKLHTTKGLPEPSLRTKMVQMVLEGKKNMEAAGRLRGENNRQPATPEIMRLLKAKIREWEAENGSKLAVWAGATLMFHGAFRGGEIFSRSAATFDPAYSLLRKDITVVKDDGGKKMVQVRLKAPKEDKQGVAVVVDVYQTDSDMCPVRATEKWLRVTAGMEMEQPAFRLMDGSPITGRKFNQLLKDWLGDVAPGISGHSFRIGAASIMGQLGFSDKEVKAIGRWGSRAFEGYMRLPRTKRRMVAEKLAKYTR